MRKFLVSFLLLTLLMSATASAASTLALSSVPDEIRPGKAERILFSAEKSGSASVQLLSEDDESAFTISAALPVSSGTNRLLFDGTDGGEALPEGDYRLSIVMDGQEVTAPIKIGGVSPSASILSAGTSVYEGETWTSSIYCNMGGHLLVEIEIGGIWETLLSEPVYSEGDVLLTGIPLSYEESPLPAGSYSLRIVLKDTSGFRGAPQELTIDVIDPNATPSPVPAPTATPAITAPRSEPTAQPVSTSAPVVIPSAVTTKDEETSYWTMTLGDLSDEQAIWDLMMQPITVLSINGKISTETYKVRVTPDKSTARDNIAGEITLQSQGVHVLKTLENGWTLIEAYNSSYGSTYTKNGKRGYGTTAELIQGYVETSALKTVEPKTDYGLLIDKLKQTMYIFSQGKIIGSLLVSTGKVTSTQPWNETPAGEFLLISRTGGFPSGNLWCAMGMRINGGCLIHEVPCVLNEETGVANYAYTEPQLGSKASHGCVRVQREKNEQGQNMTWIWNNVKVNTKVLIWEDSTQYHEYPNAALSLYYNPQGGQYYHLKQRCSSVNSRYLPLSEFTYAELENEPYLSLKPCPACNPPERPESIREVNQAHGFEQ